MLVLTDAAAIAAAPTTAPVGDRLRQLIADRVHDWTATDLLDLTTLLILENGDDEQAVVDAVGYSPLVNTLDGKRFGEDGWQPQFEWLHQIDGGWYELIQTISNDGFAIVIFICDTERTDHKLLQLCRHFAPWPQTDAEAAL